LLLGRLTIVVAKARRWPTWADERLFRGSALADFTHGIELNPRLGRRYRSR
jgi:hypothetical protein